MKDFDKQGYANGYVEDIALKLPGYHLMFDLIFNGVLPVEVKKNISEALIIGGGKIEIEKLHSKFPNIHLTLLDSSEKMLDNIKTSLSLEIKNIRYIKQTFEDYKTDIKYQLILSLLVIHFVDDKSEFLNNIYNYLEDGGFCIISAFSNQHLDWWKEYAIENGANKEDVLRTFQNQEQVMKSISPNQIEKLAIETGFRKIEKIAKILSIDLWIFYK